MLGTLFQLSCLHLTSHHSQKGGIVSSRRLRERMPWSQPLLPDVQGPLVEQLGLLVLALLSVEERQIAERIDHLGMLGSQLLLPDVQSSLEERFGLPVLALLNVEDRQIVERIGHLEMLGA